jgi:hypothetical protein
MASGDGVSPFSKAIREPSWQKRWRPPKPPGWRSWCSIRPVCATGVPGTLISDSGGAYTSNEFEAVCERLQIQHETIVTTQGASYQNLMATHFKALSN